MKDNKKRSIKDLLKGINKPQENIPSRASQIISRIHARQRDEEELSEKYHNLAFEIQIHLLEKVSEIDWQEAGFTSQEEQLKFYIKNYKDDQDEDDESEHKNEKNPPFHNFKKMDIAANAMGLYLNIMQEIEFENDPKVLKAFFAERLGQVLEAIPDKIASAIDCNIKGLDLD